MGAACALNKQNTEREGKKIVSIRSRQIRSQRIDPRKSTKTIEDIDPAQTNIGMFFMKEKLFEDLPQKLKKKDQSRMRKWHKMSGLEENQECTDPEAIE
jgi:hypothetical protein